MHDIEFQPHEDVQSSGSSALGGAIRCLVLYDGDCGFCIRWVRFFGERDRRRSLYFAPLLGKTAGRVLGERQPKRVGTRGTMILVVEPGTVRQRELERSDAALRLFAELGGVWAGLARIGQIVPKKLRDGVYKWVAANRHRWFRGDATCWVPTREMASRFLD